MSYDPEAIAKYFDQFGRREWDRLVSTPVDEISLNIHTFYLRRYVPPGSRVLEIGAGAGRFTMALAGIGARVVVADISPKQIALNRHFAERYRFTQAVEDWQVADICDLSRYPEVSFDRVVAYGGPLSYVLERRDRALEECLRVLKPGGLLLASVMSLWGTVRRHLFDILDLPPEANRRVTESGDLTPETLPGRESNSMHAFRMHEVLEWLEAHKVKPVALSTSGVLGNGYGESLAAIRQDPARWNELLRMELEASAEMGGLDIGTHLIFVGEK